MLLLHAKLYILPYSVQLARCVATSSNLPGHVHQSADRSVKVNSNLKAPSKRVPLRRKTTSARVTKSHFAKRRCESAPTRHVRFALSEDLQNDPPCVNTQDGGLADERPSNQSGNYYDAIDTVLMEILAEKQRDKLKIEQLEAAERMDAKTLKMANERMEELRKMHLKVLQQLEDRNKDCDLLLERIEQSNPA
ncbi:hypothetical protein CPB83DRAFT_888615 [Crepidotus variabilis]|uniref:Uncharacterized protein n=1 Tax=Crepidotus variabilis TaxID=179855 RepID=A0A9P6ERA2_9AGAR|nr:hypothetical protein CPB83DRAFT_888615 [Crepidotus variabilis]